MLILKKALVIILTFIMLIGCVSCGNGSEETGKTENTTESNTMNIENTSDATEKNTEDTSVTEDTSETETEPQIDNITPADNSTVVLANDEVYEWWSDFHFKKTKSDPYYRHEDIYYPNSVAFSWDANEKATYYRLFISTDENFSGEETESYLVNTNSLTLSHLYTGTKYYWFVLNTEIGEDGNEINSESVSPRSFTTAESPRCLKIDGVSNTRDIGGLPAVDGYRVKQGMIYRGGKIENITDEGKAFFRNYLNIKTDLDLRTTGEGGAGTVSPLGEDVKYVNLDGRYYIGNKGISSDEGKKIFADEVRLFADPDNYPIYIHCSLGRDRTGTLAFVIEALLGVKRNELMMDYELSVFSVTGTSDNASVSAIRSNIQATYDYINSSYSGKSFAERTENYLLDIGITPEEIQAIRDLLLEEVQ